MSAVVTRYLGHKMLVELEWLELHVAARGGASLGQVADHVDQLRSYLIELIGANKGARNKGRKKSVTKVVVANTTESGAGEGPIDHPQS